MCSSGDVTAHRALIHNPVRQHVRRARTLREPTRQSDAFDQMCVHTKLIYRSKRESPGRKKQTPIIENRASARKSVPIPPCHHCNKERIN